MNKLSISILLMLVSCLTWAAPAPTLSYTVFPLKKGDYNSVLIEMKMKGAASGKTLLTIPYESGLYRPQDHLRIVSIAQSYRHQLVAYDSSTYQVEHQPNTQLTIRYIVENALKDSIPSFQEVYAQMLTDRYFYLLGASVWVIPHDNNEAKYDIAIKWKGFPADWRYLSSHGGDGSSQQFSATLGDFHNAVYMGGDFRVYKELIHGKPLYLGIRGDWSFSDRQVLDLVRKTVKAQRAYWNDYDVDRYSIGVLPVKFIDPNERSMDGRGFSKTFVTAGTNSKALGIDDLLWLYNHELMHHWFGYVLPQGEPENTFKWFHEGFTDYFAHAAMLDAGLFNEQEFKGRINRVFTSYYSDSTHQWPNEKLAEAYWSSPAMKILPYQRGLVFALYLDKSIGFYSKGQSSLKQVVQQLLAAAKVNKQSFSVDNLLKLLQTATGKDYSADLERFIDDGVFISMADWEKVTDKIALKPAEVYDLGFTTDKNGIALNASITSLTEGGDAQKKGLQVGDVMVGYSSDKQPTHPASITVKRGEDKIKLTYFPSRQIQVPQLK